jgi:protein-S-isoprenylcysteine O-methyltransferase Ste14
VVSSLVKTLVFTLVVPGTVGVYVPWRLRGAGPHAVAATGWLGLMPLVAGTVVYLWCAWDFAAFGRGTPLPLDAPKKLVARDLYRVVRNPMYVGVLLVIFGQALLFASLATLGYGIVVALAFHLFVLLYEEPALQHQFGRTYDGYRKNVPRWIPKRAAKRGPAG